MSAHNHKALISPDGRSITFMHDGKEWIAEPSPIREWCVRGPNGLIGYGWNIWAAVEDAFFMRGRAVAEMCERED